VKGVKFETDSLPNDASFVACEAAGLGDLSLQGRGRSVFVFSGANIAKMQ
jgi:hypothetical protein